jgi:hypothetical protein
MDYEVEITAYPAKYPVGLSEDECAALESTYHLLITAADAKQAEEKAISRLSEHIAKAGARWAVEFDVFKANELEPGESPLSSEFTGEHAASDFRENKIPFTGHNRLFDQPSPPPPPPPGMEDLAELSGSELLEESKRSIAAEQRHERARYPEGQNRSQFLRRKQ